MFTRFLDALHRRPADRWSRTGAATPAGRGIAERPTIAATPRDPVLPHPSTMIEMWRQDVAQAALTLRDRAPAARVREHAERFVVRLALDLDVVVRQPPAAAQEALAVAADPDCELSRLVQTVERDPTLARGLMRHASSAMFAAAGAPASIDDAVRRLGAKGVQIAVLAGMAESLLARGSAPYSPAADQTWAHMVRVGPLARALARAVDVPAHEAFLLGLLHDIGKLVLFDLAGAIEDELGGPLDLPPDVAADAVRALHEPLGGLTLLRWGVDPRAAWAVAHHHHPTTPALDAPDRRGELLFVAERLDWALAAGAPPTLAEWFVDGHLSVEYDRVAAAVARVCATGPGTP